MPFHRPARAVRRLIPFLGALFLGLMLLVPACTKRSDQQTTKTIGVTLLTRGHIFYRDLESGLQSEAAKHGYRLLITTAEFELGKQLSQIEDFIAQKVDAIIVCPVDSKGVGPGIRKANALNIPVFTADIAATEGTVMCHIASDNAAGGRLAGEFLANALHGKGTVAIINQPVITSVLDRVQGFRLALRDYPGITIVADVNGDGVRDRAFQAASDVLQAHPNLNGIFGINDDSALGALDAVQQFNRTGMMIVGYDATPPARDAILKGSALKADVVQDPTLIGTTTILRIADMFAGVHVPSIVPVPVAIVDRAALSSISGK